MANMLTLVLALIIGSVVSASGQAQNDKLFVVGGFPVSAHKKVQVLDLSGAGLTCDDLPDFTGAPYAQVGTFINNEVVVCGGFDYNFFGTFSPFCYSLNTTSGYSWTWLFDKSMRRYRGYAAGVEIADDQWWITGGQNLAGDLISTEIWSPSGGGMGVELPTKMRLHQAVMIDETHVAVFGGAVSSTTIWSFDLTTETFTSLAELPEANRRFQGGLVTREDGGKQMVFVGGYDVNYSWSLELSTGEWTPLPPLPRQLTAGVSVQLDSGTVMVVGGYDELTDEFSNDLYVFNADSQSWDVLEQKLNVGQNLFTAFTIPDGIVNCS